MSKSNTKVQQQRVELMRLLDMIIKEYIAIVETLVQDKPVENNRIIIDREDFRRMLEQYAYATFSSKTKAYKALGLIVHDQNNYTMPYNDPEQKRTVRKVIFNYGTYLVIKRLYETSLNI